jgi:uncharacterized protein YcfJ
MTISTKTKQIIVITSSSFVGTVLIVLATLGVQSLLKKEIPMTPPAVQLPPAPPMAQVIGIKPHVITETTTVNKCHQVPSINYVQQRIPGTSNNGAVGGTLMGGALGGLAGSVIQGSARTAAILAGAGLGAYAGHEMQSQKNTNMQYRMVPKTVYHSKCGKQTITKKMEAGYEITYWYNGIQGTIIMPVLPASNTIPLPDTPVPPENTTILSTKSPTLPAINTIPSSGTTQTQ